MKMKFGMRALSLLLVMALAGAIFVPAVSANVERSVKGDIVDDKTLISRSSPIIQDYYANANMPDIDNEIASRIVNSPRISYLSNWSKDDDLRIKKVHMLAEHSENQETKSGYIQKDGRMWIDEYNYRGINGIIHPGGMEVSSSGTNHQYLTSHLGHPIGGNPCWIEVGVAKFSGIFGGDPNEYIIYTVDSTLPEEDQFFSHGNFYNGNQDFNFEIYVSSTQYPEGYPYMILWAGNTIRTGYVPFNVGNPDENHEYFAADLNSFTSVSTAYFWDSYLYSNQETYWWNNNLPETTHEQGLSPVLADMYIPWWSQAYRIDTWIP